MRTREGEVVFKSERVWGLQRRCNGYIFRKTRDGPTNGHLAVVHRRGGGAVGDSFLTAKSGRERINCGPTFARENDRVW